MTKLPINVGSEGEAYNVAMYDLDNGCFWEVSINGVQSVVAMHHSYPVVIIGGDDSDKQLHRADAVLQDELMANYAIVKRAIKNVRLAGMHSVGSEFEIMESYRSKSVSVNAEALSVLKVMKIETAYSLLSGEYYDSFYYYEKNMDR
jgi:hypothetical protein